MNETAKIFQAVFWFTLCAALFSAMLLVSVSYRGYVLAKGVLKTDKKIIPDLQIAKSIS